MAAASASRPPEKGRGCAAATAFDPDQAVSSTLLASILDLTGERIRQLAADQVLPSAGKGRYPLRPCVVAYQRWARDEARKATKSASASRVTDARAREIELQVAREEKRLIEVEGAEAVLDDIVGLIRSEAAGLGARVSRDSTIRAKVETEVDGIFRRADARLGERLAALQAGEEAAEGPAPDDA